MPANDTTSIEAVIVQSTPNPQARRNALILVLGFAALIAVGTLLLRLPAAGTRPLTWSEAFFTSASAVTVTGLNVIAPGKDLSLLGQIILMLLVEIGGIGFIAFSVALFALIGRQIGIADRVLLRQSLGLIETVGIAKVAQRVIAITLSIQLVGALLLWVRWAPALGPGQAFYNALFHSVTAFCNAGFDLYSGVAEPLFGFAHDPFTLIVLMALISIGALGILVVIDVASLPWDPRLMVHTKITLVGTAVITALSFALVLIDESVLKTRVGLLPEADLIWASLFNVVSARTAGMVVFPIESLSDASQLVLMLVMFVGGAPASMAGGVTLSTVAVLLATLAATVRGSPQATIFGRTMPIETIGKAVAIMTVATLLCFGMTMVLLLLGTDRLLPVAFEVVSAFSNTGYTVGVTPKLDDWGRVLIALTMFWGRLGPLTLVVLLAQRERPTLVRYPTEQIVMG